MKQDLILPLWAVGLSRKRIAYHTGVAPLEISATLRAKRIMSTRADAKAYICPRSDSYRGPEGWDRRMIRILQEIRQSRAKQAEQLGLYQFFDWERQGIAYIMALEIPHG